MHLLNKLWLAGSRVESKLTGLSEEEWSNLYKMKA